MPPTREWMRDQAPADSGCREVVFTEATWGRFVDWIYDKGLTMFPIPVDSDEHLPCYGIGPGEDYFEALEKEALG